mmetsp:Transcript_48777/g.125678  ORF Transcript_48777/g.125678 Transcript_48777/m.125678 type:complete len:257 (+) Transcript_48777:888-1658(+)
MHSGSASEAVLLGCRDRPPSMDLKRPNSMSHNAEMTSRKHSRRCPSPAPVSSPMNFTLTPCCRPLGSRRLSSTPRSKSPRLTEISTESPGPLLWIWSESQARLNSRLRAEVIEGCHCSIGTTASMMSLPCHCASLPCGFRLSAPTSLAAPVQVSSAPGPVASSSACNSKHVGSLSSGSPSESSSQMPSRSRPGLLPSKTTGLVSSSVRKHSSKLRTSLSSFVACRTPVSSPAITRSACGCRERSRQPFRERSTRHR